MILKAITITDALENCFTYFNIQMSHLESLLQIIV